jgi:hypothetical protein
MPVNPHKTELNPHKAIEAASRAETDQTSLPSLGQSPTGTAAGKGGAITPPAIRCGHDSATVTDRACTRVDAVMLGGPVVELSIDRCTETGDLRAPRSSLDGHRPVLMTSASADERMVLGSLHRADRNGRWHPYDDH